jgi:hypothetical protein
MLLLGHDAPPASRVKTSLEVPNSPMEGFAYRYDGNWDWEYQYFSCELASGWTYDDGARGESANKCWYVGD